MSELIRDVDYMDMELGFAYRFLNTHSVIMEEHYHNYYEYFLVTNGSVTHIVNGQTEILRTGDLVLIRPSDTHQYILHPEVGYEMINISFTAANFDAACDYLGGDIYQRLTSQELPPMVNITSFKENQLIQDHRALAFFAGDNQHLLVRLKLLLMDVLSVFVRFPFDRKYNNFKEHLELTLEKMNIQENIEEGIPALLRVTGFSHGHLCRIMKTVMDTTPTKYVTDLRMVYASNLLINSNMDVLTISMKVGYSSLSHFISTFKKKYDMPPAKYRQQYSKLEAWK